MVAQLYGHTVIWSHSYLVTQSYGHTDIWSHIYMVTQLNGHTAQLHSHTAIFDIAYGNIMIIHIKENFVFESQKMKHEAFNENDN